MDHLGYLRLARGDLLRAARIADYRGDTARHERIMSALASVDDALDPDQPLSQELIDLMEEVPNA